MSATLHWIMFQRVFGYGTTRARKIMDIIGNPSKLIEASISDAQGAKLFTANELTLLRKREELQNEAEKTLEAALKLNCTVLTPDSDGYPQRLRDIYSPPSVLYVLGSLDGLDEAPAIGMVGTRRNTDYGKRVADDLVRQLVARGVTIVSGLATGIDTISHTATLKAGGRTVAVLGNGPDINYPAANRELRELIIKNGGAVISEFPPGESPYPFHFPIRNRIISGLSLGVVVVEGTRHSGSLITAGHAVTQDRDVFAVPGNIYSPMSQATNWLISQGATPVTCGRDIVEQYPYISFLPDPEEGEAQVAFDIHEPTVYNEQKKPKTPKPSAKAAPPKVQDKSAEIPEYLSENQRKVLMQLSKQPITSDAIAAETGLSVHMILSSLTQLEIFGFAETCSGRRFIRKI